MSRSEETRNSKKILIVAGEASGDLHGSNLIRSLRDLDPRISTWGVGGSRMAGEGMELLEHISHLGIIGFTGLFRKVVVLRKTLKKLFRHMETERPDLVILIDFPDFNFMVARRARWWKIPVLYYISPQIWAWRRGRIKVIKRLVSRICVILPFEEDLYKKAGIPVTFVGHPLLDMIPLGTGGGAAGEKAHTIAILPGSRKTEADLMLPVLMEAAEKIWRKQAHTRFVLPLAPTLLREDIQKKIPSYLPMEILEEGVPQALQECRAAMVTSGTATLEAAIAGVPMVVIYRTSWINYLLGRLLIHVPFISLVNLVAGDEVVPEFIQKKATSENIAGAALRLLEDGAERSLQISALESVRKKLGEPGASQKTAQVVWELLGYA